MSSMKFILIINLLYQIISFNFQLPIYRNDESILKELIDGMIKLIMENAGKQNLTSGLTRECQTALDRTFFLLSKNDTDPEEISLAHYYYSKLLFDSSTNVNDLSSYTNCMERDHQFNFSNFTRTPLKSVYLTVFADYRNNLLQKFRDGNRNTTYLVGICFIEKCSENDHIKLLIRTMRLIKLLQENETIDLNIYSLGNNDYTYDLKELCLKFIPLFIISFHLFIIIFHKIIGYLFIKIKKICCCDNHKNKKIIPRITRNLESQDSNSKDPFIKKNRKEIQIKQHQNCKNYIKALYNIEENFDFLIKYESKKKIHNDSSLSYMNGIKGISMIMVLFGFVYIDLFNAPITKQTIQNFYSNITNPLFFIFYFGIKYAPKLLLCSSGFSLFYKFMCFLDNKYEIEKDLKKVKEEEMHNTANIISKNNNNLDKDEENNNQNNNSILSRTSSNNDSSSSITTKKKKDKYILPFKYLFLFIFSQIHKYIIYLLILFFILYSLYDFALMFIDLGPMWIFYNKLMIEPSKDLINILLSSICFHGYFLNYLNKDSILNYFSLVYQEVFYFIISTLIIFLGYKYHLRIDNFIIFITVILWLFRLFYIFLNEELNVTEYFSFGDFSFFYNSLIYNYIYYALGIYFGSLNYVIQKGYTYADCDKQKKTYLFRFVKLLKLIKKKSKLVFYILGIIFLLLIIIFSFGQYLLYRLINLIYDDYDENQFNDIPILLTKYNDNIFIKIFMALDTDIVVLLANLMALFVYLKGENAIYNILNLSFWNNFNRLYFSYILLINPIILYVFYITESRIDFNLLNCYLYSFSSGILLFTLVILVYGIFELPFKKFIKLFLKNFEIKVSDKRLDYMEKNTIFMRQMEIKGDLIQNKEDTVYEDDNISEIKLRENFIDNRNENENE